ncbi:hypothetical protein ANO11243_002920 [Dothideomycetidae sp. 11243]|nr:hypothetical protein ANO11243_002920 [fungal sp. No.11243]
MTDKPLPPQVEARPAPAAPPMDPDASPATAPLEHVSSLKRSHGSYSSTHASRDRDRLAAQVTGLVVAYVGTAIIIGVLLATLGRRARKAALSPYCGPAVEMLKPSGHVFESPVSASMEQRPWYSPRRLARKMSATSSMHSRSNPGSPGVDSLASFDARVLEADKRQRQDELGRLYAAVMEQSLDHQQSATENPQSCVHKERVDKLPRLITDPASQLPSRINQHSPSSPASQRTPIRAIYPPNCARAAPVPGEPTDSSHRSLSPRPHSGGTLKRSLRKINIDILSQLSSRPDKSNSANWGPMDDSSVGPQALQMRRIDRHPNDPYCSNHVPHEISSPKMLLESTSPAATNRLPKASASSASLGPLPLRALTRAKESLNGTGSPTKTTYLERRGNFAGGPRTGVATPYSPYMPFTPLTPVTPRLISRQERRQMQRDKGRRVMVEEDRVIDENEMWGQ